LEGSHVNKRRALHKYDRSMAGINWRGAVSTSVERFTNMTDPGGHQLEGSHVNELARGATSTSIDGQMSAEL
jgi:hypothetical protein